MEKKDGAFLPITLIANYINPNIDNLKVQGVTARVADKFVQPCTEFLTSANIEKTIKLISCAFKHAVHWEMLSKNPFKNICHTQR